MGGESVSVSSGNDLSPSAIMAPKDIMRPPLASGVVCCGPDLVREYETHTLPRRGFLSESSCESCDLSSLAIACLLLRMYARVGEHCSSFCSGDHMRIACIFFIPSLTASATPAACPSLPCAGFGVLRFLVLARMLCGVFSASDLAGVKGNGGGGGGGGGGTEMLSVGLVLAISLD